MAVCTECWQSAQKIAGLTDRDADEVYRELVMASPRSHGDEVARLNRGDPACWLGLSPMECAQPHRSCVGCR